MAQNRNKRRRVTDDGGSYHHFVPLDDDLLDVHFREGRVQKVGSKIFLAPATRSTQKSDVAWELVESWGPLDDPEFALDSDSALYDEAVDALVMQDTNPLPVTIGEKVARSKVSVRLRVLFYFIEFIPAFDRHVLTSFGKNNIVPRT
jgi:hypothetical protein